MLRYAVLCLGIFIGVHAKLDEKDRETLVKLFGKCLDEFNLTLEEIFEQRGRVKDPCFTACYFKNIKIMNEKGMLDVEHVKTSDAHADGFMQMLQADPEACKSVNEKEVSDGDKGCERAKMIAECAVEAGRKLILARKQNKLN